MFKKLISGVLVVASLLLGGCANPQIQNAAIGAGLGGVAGALLGDSSRAARVGAGLGLLAGVAIPVHAPNVYGQLAPGYGQPMYGQPGAYPGNYPPPPPGVSCPPGSMWDGRGCLRVGSGVPYPQQHPGFWPQSQQPYGQPAYPGAVACGRAALHMSCPSIQMPGGCRRCM